jgi:hypothetical protein
LSAALSKSLAVHELSAGLGTNAAAGSAAMAAAISAVLAAANAERDGDGAGLLGCWAANGQELTTVSDTTAATTERKVKPAPIPW